MNKVIVDPSLRSRLNNLDSRLVFCDESGETLGYFVPAGEQERLLYAWARAEFTGEEIERARAEPGGLTIAEILAELAEGRNTRSRGSHRSSSDSPRYG